MPYYLADRSYDPAMDAELIIAGARYVTSDKAQAIAQRRADESVTFLPTDDERRAWRARESNRFADGEYVRLPFVTRSIHYAHHAIGHVGKVAYTPDDTYGHEDRQLAVTVGRYLEQFHPTFSKDECQQYIAQTKEIGTALSFAVTADDIARVYCAPSSPDSCMGKENFDRSNTPVRAYGDSDLQVAYLGVLHATDPSHDRISSRAVVWPDQKQYVRIYGDEHLMACKLKDAGYRYVDGFDGACIRQIKDHRGRIVAPYIDGNIYCVTPDGSEWLTLRVRGKVALRETCGYVLGLRCAYCNENSVDEEGDECESCEDSRWTCDACENSYHDDDSHCLEHGTLCDSCYSNQNHTCEYCDGEINEYDYSSRERSHRSFAYCDDCADHLVTCDHCDETVHDRDVKQHGDLEAVCAPCRRTLSEGPYRVRQQYRPYRYDRFNRYTRGTYVYRMRRKPQPQPIAVIRFSCENVPLIEGAYVDLMPVLSLERAS